MASSMYPGARISIHGLQSRADLNGSAAQLDSYIAAFGRWKVRTDADEMVAIKPECVSIDMTVRTKS